MAGLQNNINRLSIETSPYLLQHATDPVDWYPWCEEAFERARDENKPIFLSIGYSACHWCHVMSRECFNNPEIATMMNDNFINIKVDREERPDLDHIYMRAVEAMTGRGGWPLSVFLTPGGKPFFGGTYFPQHPQYGMPSFVQILATVKRAFEEQREDIESHADELTKALMKGYQIKEHDKQPLDPTVLDGAFEKAIGDYDNSYGGFGTAPKFPEPVMMEFLLRTYSRTHNGKALNMVELTLEKMAEGGIYDQIGGGFHRYSTDNMWRIPHFEKMLYDNALLSRLYTHVFQITGKSLYKIIAEQTIDYLLNEMRSEEGGFYSSQDADSEGQEGRFYMWNKDEITRIVGDNDVDIISEYFGIADRGNFEGSNILFRGKPEIKLDAELLDRVKNDLYRQRQKRKQPSKDKKVIISWNGIVISSLAQCGTPLRRPDYIREAEKCADFILSKMKSNGGLMHTWKGNKCSRYVFLEDYAFLSQSLIDLYFATFNSKWLSSALVLADEMVSRFFIEEDGLFYDVPAGSDKLFIDSQNLIDGAIPSGNSSAAMVLLYMHFLTGRADFLRIVERMFKELHDKVSSFPRGFANWLCAMDFYSSPRVEISIFNADKAGLDQLVNIINAVYLPNKIVSFKGDGTEESFIAGESIRDKNMLHERTTVVVCVNNACQEPLSDLAEISHRLKNLSCRTIAG